MRVNRRTRFLSLGALVSLAAWVLWSCADPRADETAVAVEACDLEQLSKEPSSPQSTVRAFVEAAEALRTRAGQAEEALRDACNAVNGELGFPEGNAAAQACQGIADRAVQIRKREIVFPPQAPWARVRFVNGCHADRDKRAQCIAACGGSCSNDGNCEAGKHAGRCNGTCKGACETKDSACNGTCRGKCEQTDNGICDGECAPQCSTNWYVASCSSGCSQGFFGYCHGECQGSCDGQLITGGADAGADAGSDGGADAGDAGPVDSGTPAGNLGNCKGFCAGKCLNGTAEGNCEHFCSGVHRGFCDSTQGGRCTGACSSGGGSPCRSTCTGLCSSTVDGEACSGVCVGECSEPMTDVECRGELQCEANVECKNACEAQAAATVVCDEIQGFYVSALTDPALYDAMIKHGGKMGQAYSALDELKTGGAYIAQRTVGDFVNIGAKDELSRVCAQRGITANDEAQKLIRAALNARPIP